MSSIVVEGLRKFKALFKINSIATRNRRNVATKRDPYIYRSFILNVSKPIKLNGIFNDDDSKFPPNPIVCFQPICIP